MFDDPTIMAAIVAGVVSLLISAISGMYTVVQNKKRFEILRNETLAKASTESFIKAKEDYLYFFRKFERELVSIDKRNPHDGTEAIQFAINFYAERARDFYLRNKSFLRNNELNKLFNKISSTIDSGSLNDPEKHSVKKEFGIDIISFCKKLHEQALDIN